MIHQQHHLLSIVTRVLQIWYVAPQVQLELALATRHGVGIRQQKHANARILCIIYLDHHAVHKKIKSNF